MGTYSDILASEKSAAASSFGQWPDGVPAMSEDYKNTLIITWHGMAKAITDVTDPGGVIGQLDSQLDQWRGFDFSSDGSDVHNVWSTLELMTVYMDPLDPKGLPAATAKNLDIAGAAKAILDPLKTTATLVVVALGLILYLKVRN